MVLLNTWMARRSPAAQLPVRPVLVQTWQAMSPVRVQMWQRTANGSEGGDVAERLLRGRRGLAVHLRLHLRDSGTTHNAFPRHTTWQARCCMVLAAVVVCCFSRSPRLTTSSPSQECPSRRRSAAAPPSSPATASNRASAPCRRALREYAQHREYYSTALPHGR